MLERVRRMSAFERSTLMHASVIGPHFDLLVLVRSANGSEPRVRAALERARTLDLIVSDANDRESYAFRHALTRDIVYDELLRLRIKPIHRRIARALECGPRRAHWLEEVAFHWWAAGDAPRSLKYNELAGDNAAAVYAFDDARTYYARARYDAASHSPAGKRLDRKLLALADAEHADDT